MNQNPPKTHPAAVGEGRPFQKVVGNASPDTPSCLHQKRLKLSPALHGGQTYWLQIVWSSEPAHRHSQIPVQGGT